MKILTGGTFDLIHFGHTLHIRECKKLAGSLTGVYIMLITDKWAKQRKRETIISFEERKAVLIGFGIRGDNIMPVDKKEDLPIAIQSIRPHLYLYEYNTNREAHDLALEECIRLKIETLNLGKHPPNPFRTTTTSIIERIKKLRYY